MLSAHVVKDYASASERQAISVGYSCYEGYSETHLPAENGEAQYVPVT